MIFIIENLGEKSFDVDNLMVNENDDVDACMQIQTISNDVSGMMWTIDWVKEKVMWMTCMLREKY